jgi:hypothetical protein
MKRCFLDLLDLSNDPEFFWQVISGPPCIVMEETKRDGIRIEAGKRAIRFEERLIERGECRILQECLKEKRKEIGKGVWKEREAYFERNGYAGAEIERMREGGRAMTDELVQRDRDVQVQERRTRIREWEEWEV